MIKKNEVEEKNKARRNDYQKEGKNYKRHCGSLSIFDGNSKRSGTGGVEEEEKKAAWMGF